MKNHDKMVAFIKTIDVDKLAEQLSKEGASRKLALLKVDRLLFLFLLAMKESDNDAPLAIQYLEVLQKSYLKDGKFSYALDALVERGKEYLQLVEDMKKPDKRLKAIQILKERNQL